MTFKLYNNFIVKIRLIDNPGQERFKSLVESYYKKNDSIILIYNISSKESFEECKNYFRNGIKEKCKNGIKVILIGNKNDLEEEREVTIKEGYDFALENNYIFIETSCLKNESVYEAFEIIIIETALAKMKDEENNENNESLTIKNEQNKCNIF